MGEIVRRSFEGGWAPNANQTNGPKNVLLRADNATLDEIGVVGVRAGSSKINGVAFSDTDIHSLFTVLLSGTKYRYAGAGANVYRNGSSVGVTMAGSGDVAFGSYLGQVLFARGTSRHKDDGSTVRTWGIAMTGGTPVAASALTQDSKTFATFDSGESGHSISEDNGAGVAYSSDQDGVANKAIVLVPASATGRGVVTRDLGGDTDFTTLTGGRVAEDQDLITFWFYMDNSHKNKRITMQIDVNGGAFDKDYYYMWWDIEDGVITPGVDSGDTGHPIPPEVPPVI